MNKYKILVFPVPASGHVNPILTILAELSKNPDIEIISYVNSDLEEKFKSYGLNSKIIEFNLSKVNIKPFGDKREFQFLKIMSAFAEESTKNVEYLAREINEQKPDLIIYDIFAVHYKFTVKYYEKWFNLAQKSSERQKLKLKFCPSWPLPISIGFSSSFITNDGIFPNQLEASFMVSFSIGLIFDLFKLLFKFFRIGRKFGIGFVSPIELGKMKPDANTKMIMSSILPDLHPRAHLYDKKIYKFIGSTINESSINPIYSNLISIESIKKLMDSFSEKRNEFLNLEKPIKPKENLILIYASLGTVFNNNLNIYKKVIDAFKTFDDEPNDTKHPFIRKENLRVIVSTGDKVYDQLNKLIDSNLYVVPNNIVFVKSAPQLEILKRASLFITHCGMNSTSESIHFAVPMVCIPLSEDQPLVAYRVADELGLGIRLDFTKMSSSTIRNAVHFIFNDSSFYERVQRFSDLSRQHIGYKNGPKLIKEVLKIKDNN